MEIQGDPGLDLLVEEQGFPDQAIEVLGGQGQLGQPGEPGKFIDQVLEFIHLVDDDLGTFVEERAILTQAAEEAALQTLGRQFDGRQGIFYFVGDPPGHFPPGRRWALSNSVKSSNTSTTPRSWPASSLKAVVLTRR